MTFPLADGWMPAEPQWQAVCLSVLVASTATLCSLPLGIFAGWFLAKKNFFGKSLIETLINLPLVLPPVVTGYLLLITFGSKGMLGSWIESWTGVRLIFDWKGAAMAAAIVSFPLMVRSIKLSFDSFDDRLESVARTLGADERDIFFTVSLPLAKRGILAGSVLCFARSLGEFGATIMIAGNIQGYTQTIPLYIFDQIQSPGGFQNSYPIVAVSIAISSVALLLSNLLERKQIAKVPKIDHVVVACPQDSNSQGEPL